jgi:hypothetical protein
MLTQTRENAAGLSASERVAALRVAETAALEIGRSSPHRDIEVRTVYVPALECFETFVDAPAEVLAALPESTLQYPTAAEARAGHYAWQRQVEDVLDEMRAQTCKEPR